MVLQPLVEDNWKSRKGVKKLIVCACIRGI